MTVQATGNRTDGLDVIEGLLRRLALAFNASAGAGGAEAVGREIVSLGNRLRHNRYEPAGEVIAEWLDEQNYRQPFESD